MDLKERLIAGVKALPATVNRVDHRKRGYHLEVTLNSTQVRDFALLLRRLDFYLVFVSAIHLDPHLEVIYQFASYHGPCRTLARVFADRDGTVPTISDIFQGANWHERETWEMFGVVFSGHPFLVPLLLAEEDADLKPLLKQPAALKPAESVTRDQGPATSNQ